MGIDLHPYLVWSEKFTEKPVYIDKFRRIAQYIAEATEEEITDRVSERTASVTNGYGGKILELLRKYDPVPYLLFMFDKSDDLDYLGREDAARGRSIFITLNANSHAPMFYNSEAGCMMMCPWESSLDNAKNFSDEFPASIPHEAKRDDDEGRILLNKIKSKGFKIPEIEGEPTFGFNAVRTFLLTKEEIEDLLRPENRVMNPYYSESENVGLDAFTRTIERIQRNLIASFKSASQFSRHISKGRNREAINTLKKVRSGDPCLHEGNLFFEKRVMDRLYQEVDLGNDQRYRMKNLEFYADFCSKIDPVELCEESLLVGAEVFLNGKRDMKSVGKSLVMHQLLDDSNRLAGVVMREDSWIDFLRVNGRYLSYSDIENLDRMLETHTYVALVARSL